MATIKESLRIDAPIEELFEIAQDYSLRATWDPVHRSAKFLNKKSGTGAKLKYRTKTGLSFIVEYISYQPPDRVAMKMLKGPRFFRRFSGAWTFESLSEEVTEVRFQYNFTLKPKSLRLIDRVVAASLSRTTRRRLDGLKKYVESETLNDR